MEVDFQYLHLLTLDVHVVFQVNEVGELGFLIEKSVVVKAVVGEVLLLEEEEGEEVAAELQVAVESDLAWKSHHWTIYIQNFLSEQTSEQGCLLNPSWAPQRLLGSHWIYWVNATASETFSAQREIRFSKESYTIRKLPLTNALSLCFNSQLFFL